MEISLTLLMFVPFAIVLVLANLEQYSDGFRWLTATGLVLLNVLFLMAGLLGLVMGTVELPGFPPEVGSAYGVLLRVMGVAGLLGFLPLLKPVRQFLARVIPIDPASSVHMTALVYAIYLVGLGLGQQPLQTDPEVLSALELDVSSGLLWAQALGWVLLTLPGVGALIRRDWRQTLQRLGLAIPSLRQVALALAAIVGLTIFQIAASLGWQAIDPGGFQQIGDANSLLLGQLSGIGAAFTIGLSAAIGEELVFRGALQPRFGLWLTAFLFTVLHSNYGFSLASAVILTIALVLGLLRRRTNLTVCILVHFGFNFVSVLLPALGP